MIKEIKPINDALVTDRMLFGALASDLGCSVSGIPRNYNSISYNGKWEYFDPAKVKFPDDLPDHWAMVFKMHNRPDMGDCRYLKYRYVHTPIDILPQYPHIPCKGIFCLTDKNIPIDQIQGKDLIHIGNEFEAIP